MEGRTTRRKPVKKVRHFPQRSCVICHESKPNATLIRLAPGTDGKLILDTTGKAPGRGTYLCTQCLERCGRQGQLGKALRAEIDLVSLEIFLGRHEDNITG
jgi:predicted RNA-binding protein YlxR (DUF448 family)